MQQVAEGLDKLQQQFNKLMGSLKDAAKTLYPQLKQSYDKIFNQCVDIFNAFARLADTYLKAVLDMINEHQKEIQDVMNVVSGMAQDFAKVITKGLEQIKQNLEEFSTLLVNQLKALPIYETLKEKLEELKSFQVPEAILGPFEEVCRVMKASVPTEELRQLLDVTCNYIFKHIKREKVRLRNIDR